MNKNIAIKIIVPVLIVIAVAAIWFLKNTDTESPTATSVAGSDQTAEIINDDFLLETDSVDLQTLTSYGLPIIFDFGSEGCEPCRIMKPFLISVNEAMQGKAIIKYIDVWEHTDAAKEYPIQLIPTQMIINADGTPYVPSERVTLDFITYNHRDTGEHALTLHQGMLTEKEMYLILSDMGAEK
ncbi:MAG: thioredoxin family protein [Clostridiales bacterium]|nr:thioredoxin family protein [Clostridiales bacterium]